jgi:MobA-like NTP transferase domain
MAGGYGTRMGELAAVHKCKPLIPLSGKPCIDWVLCELRELDLRKIFIVVDREEIVPPLREIVRKEKLDNAVIHRQFGKHSSGEAMVDLKDRISDVFLLAYGNNLVPYEFYWKMIGSCNDGELGVALYETQTSGAKRIAIFGEKGAVGLTYFECGVQYDLGPTSLFFDKPFLLNKEFITRLCEENLSSTLAILKWAEDNKPINYFQADFPPEFHYAVEIPALERHIQSSMLPEKNTNRTLVKPEARELICAQR